jgi:hypothetical protein
VESTSNTIRCQYPAFIVVVMQKNRLRKRIMTNYPSMDEYKEKAKERAKKRLFDKSPAEQMIYLQQMSMVREAAKFSGIETWTYDHTIGALFTCSALKATFETMYRAGIFGSEKRNLLMLDVELQEDIIIHMDEGRND